jgi:hypothetical protein
MPVDQDQAVRAGLYALIGAAIGARGVYDNVFNGDEEFDTLHLATTVLTHAIAGAIVGLQGDEVNEATVGPVAVGVAHIFDKKVNPIIEGAFGRRG